MQNRLDLIVIGIYFVVLIVVGVVFGRLVKTGKIGARKIAAAQFLEEEASSLT